MKADRQVKFYLERRGELYGSENFSTRFTTPRQALDDGLKFYEHNISVSRNYINTALQCIQRHLNDIEKDKQYQAKLLKLSKLSDSELIAKVKS